MILLLLFGLPELGIFELPFTALYPQITGFQAGGGVSMWAKYSGPDTDGKSVLLRSVDSDKPVDNTIGGWTLQLYDIPSGTQVGKDRWIPTRPAEMLN